MISDSTLRIRKYIEGLINNIKNKEIPNRMNGKFVPPAKKKKINEIKDAQIEPLIEVLKYIDNHIHKNG